MADHSNSDESLIPAELPSAPSKNESGSGATFGALVPVCVIAVTMLVFLFSMKADYHNDEYTSFVIANNAEGSMTIDFVENTFYADVDEPYLSGMAVHPDHRFDWAMTLHNDSQDTLPPLYYLLLNLVFSFFPGRFSIWFAAVLNIALYVFCIIAECRLAIRMGLDDCLALVCATAFSLLPGILEIGIFIRMYLLAMLFSTCLLLSCLRLLTEDASAWTSIVPLTASLTGGALTHYYFLVLAFFICLTTGIILIARRQWSRAATLVCAAIIAAAISVLVFPPMLDQLFSGRLNDQGLDNLAHSDFISRAHSYLQVIDARVFGGLLPGFALASLLTSRLFMKGGSRARDDAHDGCVIAATAIPMVLYFLFIAKSAFYINTRYICLIYPSLVCVTVLMLAWSLGRAFSTQQTRTLVAVACALLVACGFSAYRIGSWEYGGGQTAKLSSAVEGRHDVPVVVVYEEAYRAEDTWMVNRPFSGVVFTNADTMAGLVSALPEDIDSFMVEIDNNYDQQECLDYLIGAFPDIDEATPVGTMPYFQVYVLD